MRSPVYEMPSLNMMSNSTIWNGGASLFLTTVTLVRFARDVVAILDLADAPDVDARGCIELEERGHRPWSRGYRT